MESDNTQKSNTDRLLDHLDDDSLAAKLVKAWHDSTEADKTERVKVILRNRLESIRASLSDAEA